MIKSGLSALAGVPAFRSTLSEVASVSCRVPIAVYHVQTLLVSQVHALRPSGVCSGLISICTAQFVLQQWPVSHDACVAHDTQLVPWSVSSGATTSTYQEGFAAVCRSSPFTARTKPKYTAVCSCCTTCIHNMHPQRVCMPRVPCRACNLACRLQFYFQQGLHPDTTPEQLGQFFRLTALPYKESPAQCKTYARADIPAAVLRDDAAGAAERTAERDALGQESRPRPDPSQWCTYIDMEYVVEQLPNSVVEVRSLQLMPRMRYKLWFLDAGASPHAALPVIAVVLRKLDIRAGDGSSRYPGSSLETAKPSLEARQAVLD